MYNKHFQILPRGKNSEILKVLNTLFSMHSKRNGDFITTRGYVNYF